MRATRRVAARAILSSGGRLPALYSRAAGRTTTRNTIIFRTVGNGSRRYWSQAFKSNKKYGYSILSGIVIGSGLATGILYASDSASHKADWEQIRKEIKAKLEDPKYDDGSYGPVLVRLAWHASGTYDKTHKNGGSNGATMRFKPECAHGANAGLQNARDFLEPIKQRHPEISYADLWTFAGAIAIEEMGGPKIPWRPGRSDAKDGTACAPDGRLPDASKGNPHTRDIFYRMGFTDREIVALLGAHAIGRAHTGNSGYDGPWTTSPTTFTNEFFVQLLETKWVEKKWSGPKQFQDVDSGALMMLPTDLALLDDPEFRKYVELYAKDEKVFFEDFAPAFAKLLELGVSFPDGNKAAAAAPKKEEPKKEEPKKEEKKEEPKKEEKKEEPKKEEPKKKGWW